MFSHKNLNLPFFPSFQSDHLTTDAKLYGVVASRIGSVTDYALMLGYMKRENRGHALFCGVTAPRSKDVAPRSVYQVNSGDVPELGLGQVEITTMDIQEPSRLYLVATDLFTVAGGDGFRPVVLV